MKNLAVSETRDSKPIWLQNRSYSIIESIMKVLNLRHEILFLPHASALQIALSRACQSETLASLPFLLIIEIQSQQDPTLEVLRLKRNTLPPTFVISNSKTPATFQACTDLGIESFSIPNDYRIFLTKLKDYLEIDALDQGVNQMPMLDIFSLTVRNPIGQSATLTAKEFQILSILVGAYPQGTKRYNLFTKIWNNISVVPKALDVHIHNLRSKLLPLGYEIIYDSNGGYKILRRIN